MIACDLFNVLLNFQIILLSIFSEARSHFVVQAGAGLIIFLTLLLPELGLQACNLMFEAGFVQLRLVWNLLCN